MKILFQGDSITDVWREKEDLQHMGYGYPYMVEAELGFTNPGEYEFVNRGISGNRIVDLYARIKRDILFVKPDVMSVLIGVNDVWHDVINEIPNGIDNEKFFKIYSMLIEEIKESLPGLKIFIMEPFALEGPATEEHWNMFKEEVPKRAASARKIAEKYNLIFVPLQEKFDEAAKLTSNTYWLRDGVHPTAKGHELIKREWIKTFNKYIIEKR